MYIGETKIIQILGEPTVLEVAARPPEGVEWVVLRGAAYTDVAAGANLNWKIYDAKYSISMQGTAMFRAVNVSMTLHMWDTATAYLDPLGYLIFTHNVYPAVVANAIAAGKRIYIELHVIERPENFELQLAEMIANFLGYKLPIRSRE